MEAVMENPVKRMILDYVCDVVGYAEVMAATDKKLRISILNRIPYRIPSYLSDDIENVADGLKGKSFAEFLSIMGILSQPGYAVEEESFLYLKNKAMLQSPGRTLFN
jgi:hypothetical protein